MFPGGSAGDLFKKTEKLQPKYDYSAIPLRLRFQYYFQIVAYTAVVTYKLVLFLLIKIIFT